MKENWKKMSFEGEGPDVGPGYIGVDSRGGL